MPATTRHDTTFQVIVTMLCQLTMSVESITMHVVGQGAGPIALSCSVQVPGVRVIQSAKAE